VLTTLTSLYREAGPRSAPVILLLHGFPITSKTIFIPGHGPVGGGSDVAEFRDMFVSIRDNVAALKKQGRSLNETIAAKATVVYDAKWGQFLITPAYFTGLVYAGV